MYIFSILKPLSLFTLAIVLSACAINTPVQMRSNAAPQTPCKNTAAHTLYLRGTMNSWAAPPAQRFAFVCDHYELVTQLDGEHKFKLGDEAWSAQADYGIDDATINAQPWKLTLKGKEISHRFNKAFYKFSFNMNDNTLQLQDCPDPALGTSMLYLRGSMNNWGALDNYALRYHCDAYYLNVKLEGAHEFKIADSAWSVKASLGAAGNTADMKRDDALMLHTGSDAHNLRFDFKGEYTLRLAFPGGRPSLSVGDKTFVDPLASRVTDSTALALQHNSQSTQDKRPYGAVKAGTAVTFALNAPKQIDSATLVLEKRKLEGNQDVLEYSEAARVRMKWDSARNHYSASYTFNDISVWGYYFEVVIAGNTYHYQNNEQAVHWTREQGANGMGRVEEAVGNKASIRRFRHTVYAPDFTVPAWAKDAVYYYIFPERFRNGDKRNDPKPGASTYQDKGVELHTNWNDKPYKPKTGDGSDEVYNNDFFGGDIAGILEKLDYIADLGANTLYITPMFKAASNHKYDTADYTQIDPAFGSNADFERLCSEAQRRGIRVIVDSSFNHVGSDSIYFDRFSKYQSRGAFEGGVIRADSRYADWFKFDTNTADKDKQYTGWVGIADLPEINKASPSFRDFIMHKPDSITKQWLDRGAAGWRMDVAPWVPDDFWREWRRVVKAHKPDAMTISETWWDSSKFFLGDTFDSTMNYIFRNAVLDYANGKSAKDLVQQLELMREVYPPPAFYALMNLLSTHDQARSLHLFGYVDSVNENTIAQAKQKLRLAVFLQMTYPGAPAVYYGDEVGVTGGDDPYNRATYPWEDMGGKPDIALHKDFKRFIQLRRDHAVLRHGSISAPAFVNEHVMALVREHQGVWAVTATNNAGEAQAVKIPLPKGAANKFVDALSGESFDAVNGELMMSVPAMLGRVLVSR
jgi:cyclomaltodextrinase / maltogenic alpha-amylase / neopullulanase